MSQVRFPARTEGEDVWLIGLKPAGMPAFYRGGLGKRLVPQIGKRLPAPLRRQGTPQQFGRLPG
jgi:hypothetical protein